MEECADCVDCYCTSFVSCYGYLNLEVGLTASTDYFVWIQSNHGKFYVIEQTTDADGNLSIPTEDFPEGLLHEHAGKFILTISTEENENTNEDMTIGYDTYTCIVFSMFSKTLI